MKNQETVEKNFTKNVDQWREARDRKIQNIQEAQGKIAEKIARLQGELTKLQSEILRLQNEQEPKAPSQSERQNARQTSLKEKSKDSTPQSENTPKSPAPKKKSSSAIPKLSLK